MRSPMAWLWWLGTSDSTVARRPGAACTGCRRRGRPCAPPRPVSGLASSCTTSSGRSSTSTRAAVHATGQSAQHTSGSGCRARRARSACGGREHLAAQERALADEVGDEAVGRAVVQVVGRVPLLDAALVHDADLVGDREGLVLVVGDQDRGGAGGLDDVAHFVGQALAQLDVEVGEGLVEQQQAGVTAPARGRAPRAAAGRPTSRADNLRPWPARPTEGEESPRPALVAHRRFRAGRRRCCPPR
jgi:hypothetical protein